MTLSKPLRVGVGCVVLALTSSVAGAQTRAESFDQLAVFVAPGDTVKIREGAGEEVSARIEQLTPGALSVIVGGQRRTFQPNDVLQIRQRRGDSLANGAWIGLGAGIGLVLLAVVSDDSGFLDDAGVVLLAAGLYGAIGAGIGVGIDALIRGRPVIYDRSLGAGRTMAVVPVIGLSRAGAMLSLRF